MDPCCQILTIEALPLERQPAESAGVYLTLGISVREAVDIQQPAIFFAKVGHVEAVPETPPNKPAVGSPNGQSPTGDGQSPTEPTEPTEPTDDSDGSSDPSS